MESYALPCTKSHSKQDFLWLDADQGNFIPQIGLLANSYCVGKVSHFLANPSRADQESIAVLNFD